MSRNTSRNRLESTRPPKTSPPDRTDGGPLGIKLFLRNVGGYVQCGSFPLLSVLRSVPIRRTSRVSRDVLVVRCMHSLAKPHRPLDIMCGHFTLTTEIETVAKRFGAPLPPATHNAATSSRRRFASFCQVVAEIRSRISSISSLGVLLPLVCNFGMADCSARRNSSRPGWK